ncbi:AraC family transcriptional regulator [Amycolatopsis sp. FBCC-B4732]|uniref:helix-turn-helix domain-containing protein n=1 Tax=Amycolatopsis sp. FBCC-B4732 TaxID=3079339 RepID=UPI001FF67797|nr:AraC family transcriptional regulator [Amycolatopsis sp. FBCC-B4732]UOX85281.1 AraC family transcriptional regulator [Amycolatopsis sp. FBCC-B4732]
MTVTWAVHEPHPVVRSLVTRYVGYRQDEVTLPVHRGLPSRHVTLVISLAGPVRMAGHSLRALIGGLHTNAVLIRQDRVQEGLQLELDPLGVRTLFGVTAAELSGEVADLAGFGLGSLPDRLRELPTWPQRFALLDDVLAARAVEPVAPPPELGEAWRRLRGSDGRVRVGDLAGEVGWSRRHLGERFRAELGLAPKQAARVLRFERAGRLLRRGRTDLAALAVECGYYDQAHLSNEWRALAGCTPGTWIAEELPFLQDQEGAAGQDSRA